MRYGDRRRAVVPINSCHFALRRFHGIAIHLAVLISRSTENGRWRRLVVDGTDFDPAGQKNWAAMANKARTARTDKRFVGAETWRRLRMNHTLHTSPASKGLCDTHDPLFVSSRGTVFAPVRAPSRLRSRPYFMHSSDKRDRRLLCILTAKKCHLKKFRKAQSKAPDQGNSLNTCPLWALPSRK
jgi:hypothetical protein